jgi:hypothetical protein
MSRHELAAIHRKREGPRTIRVIRYGDSPYLDVTIGAPDQRARGAVTLTPDMARELAAILAGEANRIDGITD